MALSSVFVVSNALRLRNVMADGRQTGGLETARRSLESAPAE
jgi:hypothetical protein